MKKNIAVLCADWKSIKSEKWKRVSRLKDEIIDSLEVVFIGNKEGLTNIENYIADYKFDYILIEFCPILKSFTDLGIFNFITNYIKENGVIIFPHYKRYEQEFPVQASKMKKIDNFKDFNDDDKKPVALKLLSNNNLLIPNYIKQYIELLIHK